MTDADDRSIASDLLTHEAIRLTLRELCDRCALGLDMTGASIVVVERSGNVGASAASAIIRELAEVQQTAGEGPSADGLRSGELVIANDLRLDSQRWPAFVPVAVAHGVVGVIAVPLRLGAIWLGTLTLYASTPGSISPVSVKEALVYARTVMTILLTQQEADSYNVEDTDATARLGYRAAVHQATGMVSAQLNCDVAEAFVRIRAHAYANDLSLNEVADLIVNRTLKFDS